MLFVKTKLVAKILFSGIDLQKSIIKLEQVSSLAMDTGVSDHR